MKREKQKQESLKKERERDDDDAQIIRQRLDVFFKPLI